MYVYALQQQVDAKKMRKEIETQRIKREDKVLENNVQNYYPYGGYVSEERAFAYC